MNNQPCNKCRCPLIWDKTLSPPLNSKRAKDNKLGWWREDLSKDYHDEEKCKQYQNSKEFLKQEYLKRTTTEPMIEESKLKRTDLLDNEFIKLSIDDIELVESLTLGEKEIHRIVNKQFNSTFPPQFVGMIYKQVSDKFTEIKRRKIESGS